MRKAKKRRNTGTGICLAVAAFFGAVMCISFFSVKVLLLSLAILLIILGIFLIRL